MDFTQKYGPWALVAGASDGLAVSRAEVTQLDADLAAAHSELHKLRVAGNA
ncbi:MULTISPECIES: hypothetical protein [unclassified Mycolicibacterium]|uniref:hypothetical protein n=1 Tax=unclassified Mycolicibacterium TaxID=2636767 RepID=UPI0012DDAF1F|nr:MULTISPECIES: hypothetical protein [unclassified Mycolicibacterium]